METTTAAKQVQVTPTARGGGESFEEHREQ
jgi:hypothetical protein